MAQYTRYKDSSGSKSIGDTQTHTNPSGLKCRDRVVDGYYYKDKELAVGGFSAAEGVGWENVFSSNLEDARIAAYWAAECPEVMVYYNSLTTPISTGRLTLIGETLVKLKTALNINSLDEAFTFLYLLANETTEASYKNIVKRSHDITAYGGTHTIDEGWAGNGTDAYLDTNFNPATDGGTVYQQNNASMCVYVSTDVVETKVDIGCRTSTNNYTAIISRLQDGTYTKTSSRLHTGLMPSISDIVSTSVGQHLITRNGNTESDLFGYQDKTLLQNNYLGNTNAPPNANMYIGARNYSGTAELFSIRKYAYAFAGKYFTQTQIESIYDILVGDWI